MYRRPLSVGSCQEKKPGLRGLRKLIAILIRLRGGTGAVPSLILGRHSGRPSNLPPCGGFSGHKQCLVIFYQVVQNLTA